MRVKIAYSNLNGEEKCSITNLDTGEEIQGINYLVWERVPGEDARLVMGLIPEEVLIEMNNVDTATAESAVLHK